MPKPVDAIIKWILYIDDLVQEGPTSNALAMELRFFALTHR